MVDLLIYNRDKTEQDTVSTSARDLVARLSEERLNCTGFESAEQVETYLKTDKPYDLSVLEINDDKDVGLSVRVREVREESDMMLIADGRVSPMKYLTPDIRACSLLLKPYDEPALKSVMKEFMAAFFRKRTAPDEQSSVVIENRSGKIVVPYNQIYYIEARNKKVYFRLRDKEYSKYDTLEKIRQDLPGTFVQSHRSFMFNSMYLERIKLSDSTVYLENNIMVPLSRSYKSAVKEYLRGLSGNRNDNNE